MSKDERSFTGMVQNQKILAAWTAMFFVGVLLIPAAVFLRAGDLGLRSGTGNMYVAGFALLTMSIAAITGKVKHIGILAIACGGLTMVLALLINIESLALTLAGGGIYIGGIICVVYAFGGRKGKQKRNSLEFPSTRRLSIAVKALGCMMIILLGANTVPCVHAISAAATGSTPPSRFTVGRITVEVLSSTKLRICMNGTYDLEFSDTSVTCNNTTVSLPESRSQSSSMASSETVGSFFWDGLQFCFGQSIKYYHPDRGCYGISPYHGWSRSGSLLAHCQLDEQTSVSALAGGLPLVVGLIGLAVAGPLGATVAAIVTLVLLAIIVVVGEVVLLDEENCIWWMVSTAYIQWVAQNVSWLLTLYGISREAAVSIAMAAFMSCGYLRLGNTVFYDAVGAGRPTAPLEDIPKPGTPAFHLRFPSGSRGCLVR